MSINPDVELTLSRTERVLDAEGLNPDGAALLEGLDFSGMDAAEAAGALVAKSISDGYLSEGGQVTVSVDGGSDGWRREAEDETLTAREERYERITLTLRIDPDEYEALLTPGTGGAELRSVFRIDTGGGVVRATLHALGEYDPEARCARCTFNRLAEEGTA